MATLVLKNNTASEVPVTDVGVFIPASGQATFTRDGLLLELASSDSLRGLIAAGTLTANDGSSDLTILEANAYLVALWTSLNTFVDPPLSANYIEGGRFAYEDASTVKCGTTGEKTSLRNEGNTFNIVFDGELEADITVTGAGGLQTGESEAADTWYKVLVIADSSGTNAPALLLVPDGVSFSQTGYDISRRVGWVRNDGSSDFIPFFQSGRGTARTIFYNDTVPNLRVLNNGSATSFTAVDLSSFIPPIGRAEVTLALSIDTGGGGSGNDLRVRPGDSTLSNVPWKVQPGVVTAASMQTTISMVTDTSQGIEYRVSDNLNNGDIIVVGYRDDL